MNASIASGIVNNPKQRLVLIGGGHAHLLVLKHLVHSRPAGVEVLLISPNRWQDYTGMMPGWMAGIYCEDECRIDLLLLADQAGARFIEDAVSGINTERHTVYLSGGKAIEYNLASLDIGCETDVGWLVELGAKLAPIKSFANFRKSWLQIVEESRNNPGYELAIVGGGAAGVELAFAACRALSGLQCTITLVTGARGLLPDHSAGAQAKAACRLAELGVRVCIEKAVGTPTGLLLEDDRILPMDSVIAATGARPASWLKSTNLALDDKGYVLVDSHHRSVSHTNVFAAGDICARADISLPRSGVQAVRAGVVLAKNLVASLLNLPLRTYTPKRKTLYLLSCGNRRAIASWGSWSAEGAWVWFWKNAIDRKFVRQFINK
jgi:pyridine nucleotide-disulfide oxidoreductase family protein